MTGSFTSYGKAVGISRQAAAKHYRKLFGHEAAQHSDAEWVLAYCADLRGKSAGWEKPPLADGELDRNQMAARKDAAHAEKLEMENAVRRGELVVGEEVREEWVKIASNIRASLMSLPSRLAKELSAMDEPREVQIRLDEEVRDTLESLGAEE